MSDKWWEAAPLASQAPEQSGGGDWWSAAPLADAPATEAQPQAVAQAPVAMVPEYDAMGNPTGGMVAAPSPVTMAYGEQMGKIGSIVDKGVRMAANGLTLGMADRFAGGMDALTGQAPSYSAGVDAQNARTQAVRQEAPILAGVAEAAGGLAGGVGLIKNGVTLAGRAANAGLLPRIGLFGLEGGLYGAASGAGNTYTGNAKDYAINALHGAELGGAIGAGLPMVGTASSGIYKVARALMGDNVEGVGRAGSAALRAAAQADEAGLRNLPNLGPEAMLPDAGPSMLGLAQGAATGNGPGKSALVNALRDRDADTSRRLATTIDGALGPAPVPSQVEATIAARKAALSPEYEIHLTNGMAVDTRRVADRLDEMAINLRGDAQKNALRIRGMLNVHGTQELDPNPRTLLEVRKAIDDMFTDNLGLNAKRALTEIRQGVNDALTRSVPGIGHVDDRFAELARQSDALTRGGQVLDSGKTAIRPIELAQELEGMSPGQRSRLQQGTRAEIDRLQGVHVNDLNALEKTLATPRDWNNQKARIVFGDAAVEKVMEALATNRTFRNTMQKVVEGSRTAPTSAAAKSLEASDGPGLEVTMTGLATSGLRAVAKALIGAGSEATKEQVTRLMANPAYERIATALIDGAQRTNQGASALSRAIGQPAYLGASAPASGRR
ncbi:hypothetical protein [Bosea sp. UC22_33]|uniref:hypothetical protein n=1 Tax=Bosea sp. UC22_33 TaxID=3350165 RepID=UPI00366ECAC4